MKKFTLIILSLFWMVGAAYAQGFNAQGVVTDSAGQPVIGVVVTVQGVTSGGALTDQNGLFRIDVPNNQAVLEFVILGYKTQTATAATNMRIVLESDAQVIQDIVVTGLYSTDKRLFTGATDRLVAADVKIDGMTEISRALEGRSAGVSVQNVSGTFGTAPKIRVRGATSIYGSSKPLWVVDGVIMEDVVEVSADALSSGNAETLISSAIAGLNADDIADFQILKDGSATSIYGAKAMAGVIVVTTKKGKAGDFRLNYTGEYTMRLIPTYNEFNIMNSQEQMEVYQELYNKGWLNFGRTLRARNSGVYGKMYELIDTYNPATGVYSLPNTTAEKNAYLRQAEYRNTDWFKELFNLNLMQNHAISMSGGSERATFYSSMSALVDPGWTKASKVNRYTANMNATYSISKNLSLNLIGNASHRIQEAPGSLSQETDVVFGEVKREFDINPYSYAINTSRTLDPNEYYVRNYAPFNILHELENNRIDLTLTDVRFQTELRWKIIQGLEWSALGAVKYSSAAQEHHVMDKSNQALAYRAMPDATIRDANPYLYSDPANPYAYPFPVLPEGGIYHRTDNKMSAYDFRTSLTWNKVFADKHIVNAYGGMEINSADRQKTWFRGWGRQYEMGDIPYYDYRVFKKGVEDGSEYYTINSTSTRDVAFMGNATYSYDAKYVINGTLRYEGSNKLGRSRSARWLPTWNISGAWNAHEEKFFDKISGVLSHLTLKASYSLTADRGPAFVSNSRVVIVNDRPWRPDVNTQESSLVIKDLENSTLTYEKKHELNLGIDMGFLNNRISVAADWYRRNNFDLIGMTTAGGMGGAVDKYANTATMRSGGFELSITSQNIVRRDFSWTTNVIFSRNITEITSLRNFQRVIDLITGNGFGMEGYPHRALFSIPFAGLREDGTPSFVNEDGTITTVNEHVYFQNRENVGFLKYEGPSEPTITGSLGNVFRWRNLSLNVFLTYSFGNKIRLDPVFYEQYYDLDAHPREFANRWTNPGDEAYTSVPVIIDSRQGLSPGWQYEYNSYNYSSARVADGGFIRMKEISLQYAFPESIYSKLRLGSLNAKIQVTNPFLIYADKKLNGQDPEFFRSGGVSAPVPKQFTLTLRIGF
ncbi:MAG: SusC/RagA family TonB-linked outer membrane protein [Alistipes sp.]|jgi:TonB-linked SusC/RagA family outer membrane protein|nr:SusC/RagA family TonB-linked outer membrane protein [Alistipes sp.]